MTGNDGGSFLLAGPRWKGTKPEGVKSVIQCETEFAFVLFRTQLFNPSDIENVKKVQAGYQVQTLSRFLNILNFVLQFCPTHPTETELMARFAELGIGAGRTFDARALPAEVRQAVADGMADARKTFTEFKEKELDTGKITSGATFGTREYLKNNYLYRMSAAVLGIYGNSKEEASYPVYFVDANVRTLDASASSYAIRFAPGQLPPVNAFWSLTLYELPSSLLTANPLNRCLINSPMLPDLKRDADGGLTLYVQHESPGKDKEPNWLPAPSGPFFTALRLYWPKAEALDGGWTAPPLRRVES
jgi:hypothetical protein